MRVGAGAGAGSGVAQALFEPHGSMLLIPPKPAAEDVCGGAGLGALGCVGEERLNAELKLLA